MYHGGHDCSQWRTRCLWPLRRGHVSGQAICEIWALIVTVLVFAEAAGTRIPVATGCTKMWRYHYDKAQSASALIPFRNRINLFTNEEVQFLRKYHLSIDASNPYFVLDTRP